MTYRVVETKKRNGSQFDAQVYKPCKFLFLDFGSWRSIDGDGIMFSQTGLDAGSLERAKDRIKDHYRLKGSPQVIIHDINKLDLIG
jgi:hypothetical protein